MKKHLVLGTFTALLLVLTAMSHSARRFDFESVSRLAEQLSLTEQTPDSDEEELPESLKELNYDQHRDIRWRDEFTLWREKGLPFQAKFFHRGFLHRERVHISTISEEGTKRIPYSPRFFDFGKNEQLPTEYFGDLGYSGFRFYYPINKPDRLDEVIAFLGASYFRAVAKDQQYGLSARGLALNTAVEGKKEEFPVFTHFWLKEPSALATEITIYALMESKSVTGAYEFHVQPGPETHVRVRARLFFRNDVEVVGIAPLTSMYWYGENAPRKAGTFPPEVHDSDGLLIEESDGEWLWRPLSPGTQINFFSGATPKGFGLLQRDRDANHYQEPETIQERRPSVWIEPVSGFDAGSVELIQFQTDNDAMDNVVAFWRPAKSAKTGDVMDVDYVLHWFTENGGLPDAGRVLSTWIDTRKEPGWRTYILLFGEANLPNLGEGVTANVHSEPQGNIGTMNLQKIQDGQAWRLSFDVESPRDGKPVELSAKLLHNGNPVSETWTSTWQP